MIKEMSVILILAIVLQPVMLSFACQPEDPPPDCSTYESALDTARNLMDDAREALEEAVTALNEAKEAYDIALNSEKAAREFYVLRNSQYLEICEDLEVAETKKIQALESFRSASWDYMIAAGALVAALLEGAGPVTIKICILAAAGALAAKLDAEHDLEDTRSEFLEIFNLARDAEHIMKDAKEAWDMSLISLHEKEVNLKAKQEAYSMARDLFEIAKETFDNALNALVECQNG